MGFRHCVLCFLFIGMTIVTADTPVRAQDRFRPVRPPCRLSFPADHGAHDAYRTEWWYYTGNLAAEDGRRFGFQLTFFRSALQPVDKRANWPRPASPWRSDQIYMAHAAVTDLAGGRHWQAERAARPVLSMAGVEQTEDLTTVRLHTWRAVIATEAHRLHADAGKFALELDLKTLKPLVRHGDDGYSRKGQAPHQASCYYSYTRLEATGGLTLNGRRYQVRGLAWMDHEFSTAPLQPGIVGWDWFSLHLSDGSDLMVFLLRQVDGSLNPASAGTFVPAAGKSRHLVFHEVHIAPLAYWTSPHSGARYPVEWRLRIPRLALDLRLAADLKDQEMHTEHTTGVVYWEGSVGLKGSRGDKRLDGAGYVEMTGYAEPFDAPL